ncbi:hypothetical protein [Micromonospora zamorensis]
MILEAMFAYVALSAMGLAAILAVVQFLARLWRHASRGPRRGFAECGP